MEAHQEGVDDMVELAEISEKAIAANLYVRLKKETIYVSAVTLFNAQQVVIQRQCLWLNHYPVITRGCLHNGRKILAPGIS